MSSYRQGAYSGYWLIPVTSPAHRSQDASDMLRHVYWVSWVYFMDKKLVWC